MRIHQITHLFYPDVLAGASLYTDLARYLHTAGHDVRVTTTFSYYPSLRFSEKDRGQWRRQENFNGIPVRRVGMWLPQPHKGWRRLVSEATFLGGLTVFGRFPRWKPDVVITACPMLAQVAWQRWLYPGRKIPRLVIVQDSMAHAATELGIIRSKALGRFLLAFERWSLKSATRISTISESMCERVDTITHKRVPSVVVPNWIHGSLANRIVERRSKSRRREAARLFYSGNFGVKQGLPGFLRDFQAVRGDWSISVHGAGPEADTLVKETTGWGPWLHWGSLLGESEYVDHLLTVTACVVTQMPGVGANFLPSKLLPALAARTPVLAVCDLETPLGREVSEGKFGAIVRPGDRQGLMAALQQWRTRPEIVAELGENAGRRSELYSRDRSCGAYERLLHELINELKQPIS